MNDLRLITGGFFYLYISNFMEHTICYLSKQSEALKDSELEGMFNFISEKNPILNITGALIHNNDFFLQVLEGDRETIMDLFEKIRRDKRHTNILLILNQKIENRIFVDYDAKFNIMKTKADIEKLNHYLSLYDFENKYPKNVKTLIEPFLL
jgi:hypothetical protein